MTLKIKSLLTVFFLPLFVIIIFPGTAKASLASLTAGATYITAAGDQYRMTGTTITVSSTRDNNYKGEVASGCYGCRTGSLWSDGVRQDDVTYATKILSNSGGWGDMFDAVSPKYQWGCGNSTCTTSIDSGDCNPFLIQMRIPSETMYAGGRWIRRAFSYSDPGWTSGLANDYRTDSMGYNAVLNNGGRSYLRLDYRLNSAPSTTLVSPANGTTYTLPAGSNTMDVPVTAIANDPDNDLVRMPFYLNGSSTPSGYVPATGYLEDSINRSYTFTGLAAGTYTWTAQASDGYLWSGKPSANTFTIVAAPSQTTGCDCDLDNPDGSTNCGQYTNHDQTMCTPPATPALSCDPKPATGLAPLVVEFDVAGSNLSTNSFQLYPNSNISPLSYLLNSSGVRTIYYTYESAGTYNAYLRHADFSANIPCGDGGISVDDPTDTGGGEVTP